MLSGQMKILYAREGVKLLQGKPSRLLSLFYKVESRSFSVAGVKYSDSKDVTEATKKSEGSKEPPIDTRRMATVHWLDKRTLVWDKRYKTVDEVPDQLPYQVIVASRNRFRIRANLVMIGLTILAACVMIYTGKKLKQSGDSIDKRNIEKHRLLRAEKLEEDRLAAAAAANPPK